MKKKILAILGLILLVGILSGCSNIKTVQDAEFFENIPVIDAYYKGDKIWFIHTDVTSPEMAERLTNMVRYKTHYVPRHVEAVDIDKIAKLYIFTNGIDHRGIEPWGGGPFNYQIDIFDSIPGDESYTSLRNPNLVTWNEDSKPRILTSEEELLKAEAAGELTIEKTPVVVNVPIVRWPGGNSKIE